MADRSVVGSWFKLLVAPMPNRFSETVSTLSRRLLESHCAGFLMSAKRLLF